VVIRELFRRLRLFGFRWPCWDSRILVISPSPRFRVIWTRRLPVLGLQSGVWEPSQGSPFKVFDSVTRGLRRGGSCQLGPAPRCALRSIQLETCLTWRFGSAPAAQAARSLRTQRVPSLTATRPRLRPLDISARVNGREF
jgi:hypothetical protein